MSGIRAIALLFAMCGIYLAAVGLVMLLSPGRISMAAGAPLLFGLETSGPYTFLLSAFVSAVICCALMYRINLARHAAMFVAIAGVAMLVPSVSGAAMTLQPGALARGGAGVIARVVVAWYLSRAETAQQFRPLKA